MKRKDVDVAVIGGGPAGLAAALKAKETGAEKVLIIERDGELGGILLQCIHNGFGLQIFKEDLTGPEYAQRFIDRVRKFEIEVSLNTMVIDLEPNKIIYAVNSKEGLQEINSKAIVLAMGCRERTRGALGVPGTRPAGILTAGTAQRFVNLEGYLPGKKVVILGSGDIGMIMARRLTLEGAEVLGVVEIMPYVGGLTRNRVQCLEDYGIPLLLEHTVTNIRGKERISSVTVAQVDSERRPKRGTEREIECDTLLFSVGLIPENELSKKAGILLDRTTGGPVVNELMETSVAGIFACGNVAHVYDLVDYVTRGGELAGGSAALFALDKIAPAKERIFLKRGKNIRYIFPQLISLDYLSERNIDLYLRVKTPQMGVRIEIRGDEKSVFRASRPCVRPGEMVVLTLPKSLAAKLVGIGQLLIDIEPKEAKGS